MDTILKYPRTRHLIGSSIQDGDEDLDVVPFSDLDGKYLVVEEKIDGANSGISFNKNLDLMIQSRGHFLLGNDKPHFDPLKKWANTWKDYLFDILTDRYIMYGEWMYTLHSVYYDLLPHYFMEFDIYDKVDGRFLDTQTRIMMTKMAYPKIHHVKVLKTGVFSSIDEITSLITTSNFVSDNSISRLKDEMTKKNLPQNTQDVLFKLNKDRLMEGLYIKWEENGEVKGRYKFVRPEFVQSIKSSETHWMDREPIKNQLVNESEMY